VSGGALSPPSDGALSLSLSLSLSAWFARNDGGGWPIPANRRPGLARGWPPLASGGDDGVDPASGAAAHGWARQARGWAR